MMDLTMMIEFAGIDLKQSRELVRSLDAGQKKKVLKTLFKNMQSYHHVPRAFERSFAEYELIVSATCYGQFKRHRMSTQLMGQYDITLGNTIPDSIQEVGMADYFMEVIDQTNDLYLKIKEVDPGAADYILTNSHRRRVFFRANLRELYHISRLREDAHAQWDIRNIGRKMMDKIRREWPLTTALLAGKDEFNNVLKAYLKS